MSRRTTWLLAPAAAWAILCATGCSTGESRTTGHATQEWHGLAVEFTRTLARRDYAAAYAMTSARYREETTLERMAAMYERMIPHDWGETEPIVLGHTMHSWPDMHPQDVGWAYVSISGDVYTEGVTVVIAREGDSFAISEVEFGRP